MTYQLWAETDAEKAALVQASLGNYRHETLASNFASIPMQLQHGGADDNVPPFHSRRMSQIAGHNTGYTELSGKGHWFEGIMETTGLVQFYRSALNQRPQEPAKWTFKVISPLETSTKFGLGVDSLLIYGKPGVVTVTHHDGRVKIRTRNISRMTLPRRWASLNVTVDSQAMSNLHSDTDLGLDLTDDGQWTPRADGAAKNEWIESSSKLGSGLNAIMNTQSRLHIVYDGSKSKRVGIAVANNLFQYYAADTDIASGALRDSHHSGNIVRIFLGASSPSLTIPGFPIHIHDRRIDLRRCDGSTKTFANDEFAHISAIYLQPGRAQQLELVIWGSNEIALETAARLAPTFTGVGVPDFVILGEEARWKGIDGALGVGFFDAKWNISPASVVD